VHWGVDKKLNKHCTDYDVSYFNWGFGASFGRG